MLSITQTHVDVCSRYAGCHHVYSRQRIGCAQQGTSTHTYLHTRMWMYVTMCSARRMRKHKSLQQRTPSVDASSWTSSYGQCKSLLSVNMLCSRQFDSKPPPLHASIICKLLVISLITANMLRRHLNFPALYDPAECSSLHLIATQVDKGQLVPISGKVYKHPDRVMQAHCCPQLMLGSELAQGNADPIHQGTHHTWCCHPASLKQE